MKVKCLLFCLTAVLLPTRAALAQTTLAKWTFELSQPNGSSEAGEWFTNIVAEIGSGTASAWHVAGSSYDNPAGNGSTESFSATHWSAGDFFQFAVSTLGSSNISVSVEQTGSNTGPRDFYLAYSSDGENFTQFGETYSVTNFADWVSSSHKDGFKHAFNLGSVTELNNLPTAYFRIVNASDVSISGQTVGTSGKIRIDDFEASAETAPPVVPVVLNIQAVEGNAILSWTDPSFSLQSASAINGIFTNIPGATSPYTNSITGAEMYFRLAQTNSSN
ncbi:MAG TPA: hypothetical protein VFM25_11645 [Verrucomicrobiae bacterium]|nr:hypothetical protein [Verrucomicrobiae bacterium]